MAKKRVRQTGIFLDQSKCIVWIITRIAVSMSGDFVSYDKSFSKKIIALIAPKMAKGLPVMT